MIYKDNYSARDKEHMPADRPGDCLNCKHDYWHHKGWQCFDKTKLDPWPIRKYNTTAPEYAFSNLPKDKRFETQEMRDSISGPQTVHTYAGWNMQPTSPITLEDIAKALGLPSQQTAINVVKKTQSATKDISDWRTWRHDEPGCCACGIRKIDCTYHRP